MTEHNKVQVFQANTFVSEINICSPGGCPDPDIDLLKFKNARDWHLPRPLKLSNYLDF